LRNVLSEKTFHIRELALTDPRALHALAHPVRLAILDFLREREVATATDCAPAVGESVQSCAYHLRMLAKWGIVEQVDGGDRRKRLWRLRVSGFSVPKMAGASPQFDAAWAALRGHIVARDIEIVREFVEDDDAFTAAQHRLSTVRNLTLHATPEELERLADQVSALLWQFVRDEKAARPAGAERVHAVFWLIPRRHDYAG
jgi:DNA-binding transcriptional ArsR family regulator